MAPLTCNDCAWLMVGQPREALCADMLLNETLMSSLNSSSSLLVAFETTEEAETYVDKRIGSTLSAVHVAPFLSCVFALMTNVFYFLGVRKDYKRKNTIANVKTLDILLAEACTGITLINLCALYLVIFGDASRAYGVVGMSFTDADNATRTLLEDDYCTLNSAATAGCAATSWVYAFAVCFLTSAIACSAIELYFQICTKINKKKLRAKLPKYQVYIWSMGFIIPTVAHLFGVHGPQALYCGMRCMEVGMDDDFAPEGRCVFRLVQYYGMIMINGVITIAPMIVVGKVLRGHAKIAVTKKQTTSSESTGKKKKKKKKDAVRKAQQKLMNFAMAVGVLEFLAALLRVKDSVAVPPLKEGKISITEWIPVFASLAGYFLFGWEKAPWGKFMNPCSAEARAWRKQRREAGGDSTTSASSSATSSGGSSAGG